MRVKNSIRNMIFGLGTQGISMLLAFATRTVFIKVLGADYLGIDGLFLNILSVLSLASLGFDSAIIFTLYKPISQDNQGLIKAYIEFYSKIYKAIASIIFILGLLILPIIQKLINVPNGINENINLIYILFLINTSISYLYVYKQSIIVASQKNYLISKTRSVYIILSNLLQIIFLIVFKEYIILLVIQIVMRILENITIARQANKNFEYLKDKDLKVELPKENKKELYKNVYAMLLYKVSGTVINSTDNIVISIFVGIKHVGFYSNYLLIISTIKTFVSYIFTSIVASVGNLIISEENEKKVFVFKEIQFISFWIYGFCSIAFFVLVNDFIKIWVGEKYILDVITVFFITLNFYTEGMQNVTTIYRDTSGVFNVGKYKPIIAAIINLAVSVILAPIYGIAGIMIGTIISRLSVYFWLDPYVINKHVLKIKLKEYFASYVIYFFIVCISGIATIYIVKYFAMGNFILKGIICAIIPNLIFMIIYWRNQKLKYILNIIKVYKNN